MSHSKRIAAVVLVAGAVLGAGALPASATERDHDRGRHYGQQYGHHYGHHHGHGHHGLGHGWLWGHHNWR